ncbi:hypothetical protein CS063_05795 [Sporanaerobium hydrogeniformans]|uniref:Uncharacterized protein n=1 Tax=Sporanaerobium hydrogeniformans TaxID=3072179 RepID=A0AC61DEH9_9FIRM|nr:hypothetical protein [Sporanaerobium hydrogeniformans]PHV71203.1 hypothetical protein CS063_05795 [Sporanaerobium hydrogeniformans]
MRGLVDQKKIILMTKLAIYEKNYGKEDRRRNRYYLEDYIYIKNFKTRLSVTLVVFLVIGFQLLKLLEEGIIIPTSLMEFVKLYIAPYSLPWIVMMIIYTMISTVIYGKRYASTQKRLIGYRNLLKKLTNYEQTKRNEEGVEDEGK